MEKGYSTSYKSIVYQKKFREAAHNQTSYGDKIYKLSYVEETVADAKGENFHHWYSSTDVEKQAYYILNLKDKGLRRYPSNIITSLCGRLTGN